MDWTALHTHFVDATSAEPFPFGPDAVELDYSRLSRALGEKNGLQDQPWSGLAFLSVPDAEVDGAARQYSGWAAEAGWRFLRLSARPTVAAPEPVAYGLGAAISGEDSLIFAGARDMGRPARGKRPRSKACSMPLSPGERWAIAVDRVRRRTRQEIAREGLLLFVESAEMLTPAALNHLLYYANAHRAWRANMLCEPARCYIALAAAPGKAHLLREFLERCGVSLGLKAEIATGRRADRPVYGIEEEHILAAVADAPHALAEADLAALFGSTGRDACRRLQEVGLLTTRSECGVRCILPTPAALDLELPLPPARVREAVLERYRLHDRKGREHVLFGSALLQFRLGRRGRAMGHLGAAGPSDPAFVPIVHFEEIDRELKGMDGHLRACDLALAYALSAHQRSYAEARLRAEAIGARSVRRPGELARVITRVLCVGRGHMDASLPEGFWATIRSESIDPALLDATCILSELFARLRGMSEQEIKDRYDIARESLTRATVPPPPPDGRSCRRQWQLWDLLCALWWRADIGARHRGSRQEQLILPTAMGVGAGHASVAPPGYVIGTLAFAIVQYMRRDSELQLPLYDRILARRLMAVTMHSEDGAIQEGALCNILRARGLISARRSAADEWLLLLPYNGSTGSVLVKQHICALLSGRRQLASGVLSMGRLSGWPVGRTVNDPSHNAASAAHALIGAGDYASARVLLSKAMSSFSGIPARRATILQTSVHLARVSMQWEDLSLCADQIEKARYTLPAYLVEYLDAYLAGTRCHCERSYEEAIVNFDRAIRAIPRIAPGEESALARRAVHAKLLSRKLMAVEGRRWEEQGGVSAGRQAGAIRRVVRQFMGLSVACSYGPPTTAGILDCLLIYLDTVAESGMARDTVLQIMHELHQCVGASLRACGSSLSDVVTQRCPSLSPILLDALKTDRSDGMQLRETLLGLDAMLSMMSVASHSSCGDDTRLLVDMSRSYGARLSLAYSRLRQERTISRTWLEDGAVLQRVRSACCTRGREHRKIVCVGHSGDHVRKTVLDVTTLGGGRAHLLVRVVRDDAPQNGRYAGSDPDAPMRMGLDGEEVNHDEHWQLCVPVSTRGRELADQIRMAAASDMPVLIVGETGAGKEVVARQVHGQSHRCTRGLYIVDCGGVVEGLMESELFGHERGAFSGASEGREGILRAAHGGTVLFDNIECMSPRMQVALLRAIETGEFRPVGAATPVRSDFRVICTARESLRGALEEGRFRRDLYFRIAVLRIDVPAVRERIEDAVLAAGVWLAKRGRTLSEAGEAVLRAHKWPGNFRELRSALRIAASMSEGPHLDGPALSRAIQNGVPSGYTSAAWSTSAAKAYSIWDQAAEHLRGQCWFGAKKFSSVTGLPLRSAQRQLANLVRAGRLVRAGAGPRIVYCEAGRTFTPVPVIDTGKQGRLK